jgi:translation elongation factor EF-1alpha
MALLLRTALSTHHRTPTSSSCYCRKRRVAPLLYQWLSTVNTDERNDDKNHDNDNNGFTANPNRLVSIVQNPELINKVPLEDVRSFCIIAHIDHGKSSISSRLLELTGNLGPELQREAMSMATKGRAKSSLSKTDNRTAQTTGQQPSFEHHHSKTAKPQKEQIELLDTLTVERERGITVKASTATMLYPHPSAVGPEGVLLINCIDCPGHSDFSSEVARSLSFVQGAVLLLDASQGIQVQQTILIVG